MKSKIKARLLRGGFVYELEKKSEFQFPLSGVGIFFASLRLGFRRRGDCDLPAKVFSARSERRREFHVALQLFFFDLHVDDWFFRIERFEDFFFRRSNSFYRIESVVAGDRVDVENLDLAVFGANAGIFIDDRTHIFARQRFLCSCQESPDESRGAEIFFFFLNSFYAKDQCFVGESYHVHESFAVFLEKFGEVSFLDFPIVFRSP